MCFCPSVFLIVTLLGSHTLLPKLPKVTRNHNMLATFVENSGFGMQLNENLNLHFVIEILTRPSICPTVCLSVFPYHFYLKCNIWSLYRHKGTKLGWDSDENVGLLRFFPLSDFSAGGTMFHKHSLFNLPFSLDLWYGIAVIFHTDIFAKKASRFPANLFQQSHLVNKNLTCLYKSHDALRRNIALKYIMVIGDDVSQKAILWFTSVYI